MVIVLLATTVSSLENSRPLSTNFAEALDAEAESTVTKSMAGEKVKEPVPADAKS
jgi:hypothetical protein